MGTPPGMEASERPQPDHTEDPRRQGTGQGYPETQPEEATPVEGTDEGPAAGTGGEDGGPEVSTDEERDRGASTGNPGTAG